MKITNLEKRLGNFVLKVDQLHIKEGINHCFIGFNGSGKSTLAKLIMGLIKPDKGEIDLEHLSDKDITMTLQRPYLMHDSLYENIAYPLKLRGMLNKAKEDEIDHYLNLLGLYDKKLQYALSLSSGERQKLSMIRGLIFDPKLMIIDESLSNMDIKSKECFDEILINRRAEGMTTILISHQLAHAKKLCQEAHFFDGGRILESGPVEKIFFNPDNPIISEYVRNQLIEVNDR